MRKTVLYSVVVVLVLYGLVWVPTLTAEEQMCVPMGKIALKALTAEAKRATVTFPHNVHFSYACLRCHHSWDSKSPIAGCTTSGCHDLAELPKGEDGKPSKDVKLKERYFKNAFHDMCIDCHKDIKKKNMELEASRMALGQKLPPTGPTGCNECHPQ